MSRLIGVFVVAPVIVMRLDWFEPIHIDKLEMVPSDVRAGQTVKMIWTANEYRACDGIIHRRFVDSAGVIFEIESVPSIYRDVLGNNKTFNRDIQIPSGMAPGPAVYGGVRRYWCNPLQKLFQGWLGFEIVLPSPLVRFKVVS